MKELAEELRRTEAAGPTLEDRFIDVDPEGIHTRRFSEITYKPVEWLWKGYIVAGALNLLDGDPGVGKSLLTCRLAAYVTGGDPLPGHGRSAPGNVLILSHEDEKESGWQPRLKFAGADLDRVISWDHIRDEEGREQLPEFPADLGELEYLIVNRGVKLVIIDPLFTYLDTASETGDDKAMKKVLTPLNRLAQRTGCTILGVRHLNKNKSGPKTHRGNGSLGGIAGSARSVLMLEADGDDTVVLRPVKLNGGRKATGFRFQIEEHPLGRGARLANLGSLEVGVRDKAKAEPEAPADNEDDGVRGAVPLKPDTTTAKDVAKKLGRDKRSVNKALTRLLKAGDVELKEKGAGRRPDLYWRGA